MGIRFDRRICQAARRNPSIGSGWKAGEADFVAGLASRLRPDCEIEIVTKSPEGGELVQSRLQTAGVRGPIARSPGGFREWLNGTRLDYLASQVESIVEREPQYAIP